MLTHAFRDPEAVFRDIFLLTMTTPGAFGARNIPKCLRAISILGMKQARAWNCGSLNEFRKFFGLKTYDTFEEINPDPYVAEQLKNLYGRKPTGPRGDHI